MKSLHDLVYEKLFNQPVDEKLVINKKSQVKTKVKIDPALIKSNKINNLMWDKSPGAAYKHRVKMEGYMRKGSKPARLVNDIKDNNKLVNRWFCAVELEWDEAIQEFGKAIENRGLATLNELHGYILYQYSRNHKKNIKNYLDLYNIDYDETN